MSLTLVATAEPANSPPRVRLDITESDPLTTVNSVALSRGGVPLRFDPVLTGLTAIAYDYDAPFDTLLAYRADVDESVVSVQFTETWPNTSAWTGAGWTVSSGVASATADTASIERAVTLGRLNVAGPVDLRIELVDASNLVIGSCEVTSGQVLLVGQTASQVAGSGVFDLAVGSGVLSAVGSGWSVTVPFAGTVAKIRLKQAQPFQTLQFAALGQPDELVLDSSGNIFVCDFSNFLIHKFDSSGTQVAVWSTTGQPSGIAVDASGNVYVSDRTNSLIRKYNSSGVQTASWSTTGVPASVAISGSTVYVADATSKMVRRYTTSGTPTGSPTSWTTTGTPDGIDLDGSGNVYVTDTDNLLVRKFNSSGTQTASWSTVGLSFSLYVDGSGFVYVADVANKVIHKFDSSGTQVAVWSTTGAAAGVALDTSGNVYASDATANLIRKYHQPAAQVDDLTAYTPGVEQMYTASDSETLTATGAWLTNAAQPDLAAFIQPADCSANADFWLLASTRETTTIDENAVALQIEGSGDVVSASLGPRPKESWNLDVGCASEIDRKALVALLANSAVVNLRFPASLNYLGLDGGFYSVGKAGSERETVPSISEEASISLPLTPSRAPAYKPLWQWNMRTHTQTGMTMRDSANVFPTMRDRLVGPV